MRRNLGILLTLGILFTAYIFARFLIRPIHSWKSASNYSTSPGCYFMLIHWIGGCLVILIGPLQLNENIRKYRCIHILLGRFYIIGCILASIGGLLFIFVNGTVGGLTMNIAFTIYGILLLYFAITTYSWAYVRNVNQHQRWALRTFGIGIGSLLYRVYVFPLYFNKYLQLDKSNIIIWLNICAWLMFIPNVVIIEYWIHKNKKYNLLKKNSIIDVSN
jgi:hypothetical protein